VTLHPPLGHDFDSEAMVCPCGRTWCAHQEDPRPCDRVLLSKSQQPKRAGRPVGSMSEDSLAGLRVAMGLPASAVAEALGLHESTVIRAEQGKVGGKGRVSRKVRDEIEEFLEGYGGRG